MITYIALGLVAMIVVILAIAATKPATYGIQRAIDISAPPDAILPLLADLKNWRRWSSFEDLDPNLQRTYSGAAAGVGAVYSWTGNNHAGEGRMEVVTASPSGVSVKVDFKRPFVARNTNEFVLDRKGAATHVTWNMNGTRPFMLKVMSVFISPDKMMGSHFESGLAKLKTAAESDVRA